MAQLNQVSDGVILNGKRIGGPVQDLIRVNGQPVRKDAVAGKVQFGKHQHYVNPRQLESGSVKMGTHSTTYTPGKPVQHPVVNQAAAQRNQDARKAKRLVIGIAMIPIIFAVITMIFSILSVIFGL